MSPLPFRDQVYHLHSAERRTLIINHPWHTEYACALYFMSTYVHSTVQSARLWWYSNRVMCVGVCVCVWFLSIAVGISLYISHFPARPLSHQRLFAFLLRILSDLTCLLRERERERERRLPSALCLQKRHQSTARWDTMHKWVTWRCLCCLCRLEELIQLSGLTPHTVTTHNPPAGLFIHYRQMLEWKNYLLQLFKLLWFFSGH